MGPITLRRTDVLTDGAVPQGHTAESRDFTLIGTTTGVDRVQFLQKRKKLSLLIRPDALDGQPLNLLHQFVDAQTGEPLSEQITIECRYKDGLRDAPKFATVIDDSITFEAHRGYFYANALDGYRLGEKVPYTSPNVIMRKKTGEWVALPGLDGVVRCLAEETPVASGLAATSPARLRILEAVRGKCQKRFMAKSDPTAMSGQLLSRLTIKSSSAATLRLSRTARRL